MDTENYIEIRDEKDSVFNCGPIDYSIYNMTKREKVLYILAAGAFLFALGFIFYQNIIVSLIITPISLLYPKIRTKEIINKRLDELNLQFKDLLYSISSSLASGKALETSFRESLKELSIIYPNEETFIIKEVLYITKRLDMNDQIENILMDFAERSDLEDIRSFANVLQTCNKRGGNVIEIIRNTSNVINDKIEVKQEITTILAQKKFEQKVLNFMPVGLILFLSVTQKDYMKPVFSTLIGRVVMTFAIILIIVGYNISKKIMDIKI
ncbi:MAG: pilus assembly protein TadB [Bacillota bacterium]|nr:pilus assembly protein TadB [Bacillota bacterium]